MATISLVELEKRYDNSRIIIDAVDSTICNPDEAVCDHLAKGNKESRQIAATLAKSGATISAVSMGAIAAEAAAIGLVGGAAVVGGGLVAGGVAAALGGPIVWTAALLALLAKLWGKIKKKRKARTEKEALMEEIIRKQQAVIDKLRKENSDNATRIHNLEEALKILEEMQLQVVYDFAA